MERRFPALLTPFTASDELDLSLFAKNLEAQLDAGVDGIVLGGTLGEASVLTTEEKEQLVKFAIATAAGRVPVVLNIAEGATREALRQAELAEKWGPMASCFFRPCVTNQTIGKQ